MRAESIARALGGRKAGSGWSARCPAHDDRTPSLSLRETGDGKVLVRCHAGCDQDQVIAQLKASGLWTQNGPRVFRHAASRRVIKPTEPDHDHSKRTEAALSIWQAAKPAGGTLVESYLRARRPAAAGNTGAAFPPLPETFFRRFLARHDRAGHTGV